VNNPKHKNRLVVGLAVSIFASTLGLPRAARAADSDVDDLKREVRALQAQLQSLRAALAEAAELDRQRAAVLARALKATGGAPEPAPAPAADAPMPPTRRPEPPAAAHKSAPALPPEVPTGSLRGKVSAPGGEPVAYVYVENVLAPPVKGQRVVIDQSGKRFLPGWAVIQRGTTIEFPNKDNIYHNVFSLSPGNAFDLGMYAAGTTGKTHTFMEAGPVDVFCNIHPQMAASVLVVPNRYFAKVKADGTFEIPGVPSGRRKVVAWSPGSRPTVEWVEVSAGAAASVSFKLAPKSSAHTNKAGQAYGSYE
jgi:plastocyanin